MPTLTEGVRDLNLNYQNKWTNKIKWSQYITFNIDKLRNNRICYFLLKAFQYCHQWEGENGQEEDMSLFSWGPNPEVAHTTASHMPLARTKAHDYSQLQGRLGDVVFILGSHVHKWYYSGSRKGWILKNQQSLP